MGSIGSLLRNPGCRRPSAPAAVCIWDLHTTRRDASIFPLPLTVCLITATQRPFLPDSCILASSLSTRAHLSTRMLPRSPSPSAPLLGRTHHHSPSPSSSHAPKAASTAAAVAVALPARRARRLALVLLGPLLLVLTLVALAAAATSSDGSRLKEIAPDWVDGVVAQRLQRLGIGSGLGSKQAAVGSEGFLAEEDGAEHELLPPPPAPRNWSREDRALRRYAWKTPPVHSSLERMLAGLTEVRTFPSLEVPKQPDTADRLRRISLRQSQNRTRTWLLQSRNQTTGGTGIGLGAADPPERIRPAPALPAHPDGQLSASQGPGLFNTGSPRK